MVKNIVKLNEYVEKKKAEVRRKERRVQARNPNGGLGGGKPSGKTGRKLANRARAREQVAFEADAEAERKLAKTVARAERAGKLELLGEFFGEKDVRKLEDEELEELLAMA